MQFCTHPGTSDKQLFPTFARTRPPDTQISKSVASVLLKFKWSKVALLYSQSESSERDFEAVAKTIQSTLTANQIEVRFISRWTTTYHYGYTDNPFNDLVERSYRQTRSKFKKNFTENFSKNFNPIKCRNLIFI